MSHQHPLSIWLWSKPLVGEALDVYHTCLRPKQQAPSTTKHQRMLLSLSPTMSSHSHSITFSFSLALLDLSLSLPLMVHSHRGLQKNQKKPRKTSFFHSWSVSQILIQLLLVKMAQRRKETGCTNPQKLQEALFQNTTSSFGRHFSTLDFWTLLHFLK